ncbi:MAG: hypothetical protein E4G96_04255 [Chrysiogenales bacterium]|nr:MAG: hypothetical protein E4G96_04255 [Chrysiogenales bacterium]
MTQNSKESYTMRAPRSFPSHPLRTAGALLFAAFLVTAFVFPAHAATNVDERVPLTFKSVIGHWLLKYPGNYGYRFNLFPNYRATVTLYLNNETIFFNGVYTISDTDRLRINIYEMKVERRSDPGRGKGYVKAQSSHFLFSGYKTVKNRAETLYLRPLAIIIDGTNSEGYFEPLIKLDKVR